MIAGILVCIAIVISYNIGYIVAHKTIALECERLGSFFVGKQVYKCVAIENNKTEEKNNV